MNQKNSLVPTHLNQQEHYHQPVNPHSGNYASTVISWFLGLAFLIMLIVGIVKAGAFVTQAAVILIYILAVLGPIVAGVILIYPLLRRRQLDKIKIRHAEADVKAKEDAIWRSNSWHLLQLEEAHLLPDPRTGNYPAVYNRVLGEVIRPEPGQRTVDNVPHTYAPHNHYEYSDKSSQTGIEGQNLLGAGGEIHIPTFAESLAAGDIGPHQQQLLFCHQLVRDEQTQKFIELVKEKCNLGDASTLLLSGQSKSGKTTYMVNLSVQQAFMQSVFFGVDPHRNHPEKSLTSKLAALIDAGYFVLPPAMSDQEVFHMKKAIETECQARVDGKETRLSGYNIVVLIDEIVALMSRAMRTSNKEVQQMYREFGILLRDIGTQYNKFGVNGIYGTQYVTKEVLGEAEWRDACTGQGVLKLPANQAQALKLLHGDDLRSVPSLAPGHGFMVFGDEYEPIRMASGNITVADVERVARLLPPSPLKSRKHFVPETSVREMPSENQSETTQKPVENQSENQSDRASNQEIEEKLQKVLDLEAQGWQKPEIMVEVWGVHPSGGAKYKTAEEEYKLTKRMIRERLNEKAGL